MARSFLLGLPSLPQKPGCSFRVPPLDGSLTIPELFEWHSIHNPTHGVFIYASTDGVREITFSVLIPIIRSIARLITRCTATEKSENTRTKSPIAVLAHTDTVTYFSVIVASMYAGKAVFPISPRLPASAIAHLLNSISVSHIFISKDLEGLVRSAIDIVKDRGYREPRVNILPPHVELPGPTLGNSEDADTFKLLLTSDDVLRYTEPAIYVHSSGSSSLPKAVPWTQESLLQVALTPYLGDFDLRGEIFGAHAVPMFHASGLNFVPWVASTGFRMAIHSPLTPLTIPTPDGLLKGIIQCNVAFLICVPSFLEAWVEDPQAVEVIKGLKAIAYGGGPLSKSTGDRLTAKGVKIITVFGSTEGGVISALFSEYQGEDWEYFSINPHCSAKFELRNDGLYELIIVKQPTQVLAITDRKYGPDDAYSTNDLFSPHPSKAGYWKPRGRKDDQIILTTGMKINPGPLEEILMQHHLIECAILFGSGHFQVGALIFPRSDLQKDKQNVCEMSVSQFLDDIGSHINKMNEHGPRQARLVREMVLVASPDRGLLRTAKGTVPKSANIEAYESEIETLYSNYETRVLTGTSKFPNGAAWDAQEALEFVRKTVLSVLPGVTDDATDIFLCGCDSLQATWIRIAIMNGLPSDRTLGHSAVLLRSMVYNFPTISSLASVMVTISNGNEEAVISAQHSREDIALVAARYTHFEPQTPVSNKIFRLVPQFLGFSSRSQSILITGSTGALGCHLLASLVSSDNIKQVFTLIRPLPAKQSLLARQRLALEKQGLPNSIAESSKIVYVELQLRENKLLIDSRIKKEISRSVTHLFHLAWPVNFNRKLKLFDEAFAYTRSLIDLCLESKRPTPPRFIFSGSTGIFQSSPSSPSNIIGEAYVNDVTLVSDMGYCQSKWIAEEILRVAARETMLQPIIIRVGQLAGSTLKGAWNTSEWFPAMVKSSMTLGYLPTTPGMVSWLPVDIAANAFFELRNTDRSVVHVVHPISISYSSIVNSLSEFLKLPTVPLGQWLIALQAYGQKDMVIPGKFNETPTESVVKDLPALSLVDFFSQLVSKYGDTEAREAFSSSQIESLYGAQQSDALRKAQRIGKEDVSRWLAFWEQHGFLTMKDESQNKEAIQI